MYNMYIYIYVYICIYMYIYIYILRFQPLSRSAHTLHSKVDIFGGG